MSSETWEMRVKEGAMMLVSIFRMMLGMLLRPEALFQGFEVVEQFNIFMPGAVTMIGWVFIGRRGFKVWEDSVGVL